MPMDAEARALMLELALPIDPPRGVPSCGDGAARSLARVGTWRSHGGWA
jgi:hypothetical protein